MSLFQTIPGCDWSTLDERVWNHPGAIVDLGCNPWDWSKVFIGKKRVIGADPFAAPIDGTELFQGVVCDHGGIANITVDAERSTVFSGQAHWEVPALPWADFIARRKIESIAALKLNIEGGEYAVLDQICPDSIDQIAVSFHLIRPNDEELMRFHLHRLLLAGYTVSEINKPWRWFLCRR